MDDKEIQARADYYKLMFRAGMLTISVALATFVEADGGRVIGIVIL